MLSTEQTIETMLEEEHQCRLAFDESESSMMDTSGVFDQEEKVCDISADLTGDEAQNDIEIQNAELQGMVNKLH